MSTKEKKKVWTLKNAFTIIIAAVLLIAAFLYYFYKSDSSVSYDGIGGEFFVFGKEVSQSNSDSLTVHFIDVGQGDCVFIEFPDDKNMLIDGGLSEKSSAVINYLEKLNVEKIDLVLATHSDKDHVGALPAVFKRYDVSYCFRPMIKYAGKNLFGKNFNPSSIGESPFECKTDVYRDFLQAVEAEKCGWSFFNKDSDFSQSFMYNGETLSYTFDFLTPTKQVAEMAYNDSNDYSPICLLTYGSKSFMFTGDAEKYSENEYLLNYGDGYDVDVLKVGHHGSRTSSSPEFISAIKPEIAVISCEKENEYGQPHEETLENLASTWVYRTDLLGDIVIEIKSDKLFITPPIEDVL